VFDFSNKNILVTGGTGGIGSSIVKLFKQYNGNVISINSSHTDFRSTNDIISMLHDLPTIDICINCAGINVIGDLHTISEETYDDIMQINVKAPFLISQYVSGYMKSGYSGKIVNISSIWGEKTISKRLCYTTSKAALIGMTKTLAVELAKYNILVNTVSPGFTDTELTRSILSKPAINELIEKVPLQRMASPDEIANTVLFLSSDLNSYITGQNIIIDGGFSVT